MKKILLFMLTSASVLAAYLLVKNCGCANNDAKPTEPQRQRHLTKVFSNAKQHAVS